MAAAAFTFSISSFFSFFVFFKNTRISNTFWPPPPERPTTTTVSESAKSVEILVRIAHPGYLLKTSNIKEIHRFPMKNQLFRPPENSRYLILGSGRALKPFKYKENGDFTRFSSNFIKKWLFDFFAAEVVCPFRTGISRSKWIATWIIILRSSFSTSYYDAKMWLSPWKYQLFSFFHHFFKNEILRRVFISYRDFHCFWSTPSKCSLF